MKERIAEAFIELVNEKKSFKIGVLELCQKAGISKPTFYKYFADKYAVTEYIFRREIIEPMESLAAQRINGAPLDGRSITADFYRSFFRRKEFYSILIREDKQNSLIDTIIESLVETNRNLMKISLSDFSETDIDYIAYRHAALQAALLKKWMHDGMTVSPEKMAEYYYFEYEDSRTDLLKFKKVK